MSQRADRSSRRYSVRITTILAVGAVAVLAACGSDDSKSKDTLPPIATTTTTTTMPPTTTTIPDTYVIQPGESLSGIAKMFGLTTQELALFNGISNPSYIQAGQEIKIPQADDLASTTIVGVATSIDAAGSVVPVTTVPIGPETSTPVATTTP